jgi:UDP-2,3-diacylglucosamine pyrophosphatase LpxH
MQRDDALLRAWTEAAGPPSAEPTSRAPPLPQRLDLRPAPGHAGLPGACAARLPEARRERAPLPGRRHHRRLAAAAQLVLAAGAQRRRAEAAAQGAQGHAVVFIPGNHDEFARRYVEHNFGGIDVAEEWIHRTADGRRLWIVHGDLFDGVIQCAKWLAHVGDSLYEFTLKLNRHLNSLRARMGLPYWSLSKFLKLKVKRAVSYVGDFEAAVAREARKRGVQGVVCGHIHHAELREIDGIVYANDGDWVESLTALVEHADGRLEIIDWSQCMASIARPKPCPPQHPSRSKPHEARPRDRRLAAPGQRRRHHAARAAGGFVEPRPRGGGDRAVGLPRFACPATARSSSPGGRRRRWRRCSTRPPDAIHIATEGRSAAPRARTACAAAWRSRPRSTPAFPTSWRKALHIPERWGYAWFKRFHAPSAGVMVPTDGMLGILRSTASRTCASGRTASTCACSSRSTARPGLPRPVFLYRRPGVVREEPEAFLDLDLPGSKLVYGDGPLLERLKRGYPQVHCAAWCRGPTW